jgi:hypothetical protein
VERARSTFSQTSALFFLVAVVILLKG